MWITVSPEMAPADIHTITQNYKLLKYQRRRLLLHTSSTGSGHRLHIVCLHTEHTS